MRRELTLATIFRGRVDRSFDQAIKRLETALARFNTTVKQAVTGTGKLDKQTDKLSKRTRTAAKDTDKLTKASHGLNKQISKVHGGIERVTAAMKVTASYGIAATGIFAVTNALREGVSEIMNFDQALKNIQAISNATDRELLAVKDRLEELAITTKFSTTEMAEGMVLLNQAGLSAGEAINAIGPAADLATGTLSGMTLSTDLLSTTLRAFDMSAIESTRVADVMANAITKSKLTVDKLRISFNYIGAAAHQTGLSLEQTAAAMMTLANHGLRASTIGTGMRQVLARLLAPNRRLREAFKLQGIQLSEVNPRLNKFEDVLKNLMPVLIDQKKGVVDMGKAYELFGLRGAQAAAILIKGFLSGQYDEMLEKVSETGTAAKMAAKQAEGLAIMWKNLSDRAGVLAIKLGDVGLTGALRSLIRAGRELINLSIEFVDSVAGRITVKILAITATVYLLIKAFRVAQFIWRSFIGSFLKLSGPMAAILALSAVIGIIYAVFNEFGTSLRRRKDEMDKLAIESRTSAESLELFRTAIEKAHEKGEDYTGIIERLVSQHKDLKGIIDQDVKSYEDLMRVMRKYELIEVRKSLKQTAGGFGLSMEESRIEEDRLRRTLFASKRKRKQIISYGMRDPGKIELVIKETTEKIENLLKEREQMIKDRAGDLADVVQGLSPLRGEQGAFDEVRGVLMGELTRGGKSDRFGVNEIMDEVMRIVKRRVTRGIEFSKKKIEELTKDIPDDWLKMLNKLSGDSKYRFLEVMTDMRNALATKEKEWEALLDQEIIKEADVLKLKKSFYDDWWQTYMKGEWDAQEKVRKIREKVEEDEEKGRTKALEAEQDIIAAKLKAIEIKLKEGKDKSGFLFKEREFLESESVRLERELDAAMKVSPDKVEQFNWGLKEAADRSKELGGIWYRIGTQIEDKIAGGLTDGIFDFIEGVKTAKEAFTDFAKSTLRWLGEIILKEQILKVMRGPSFLSSLVGAAHGGRGPGEFGIPRIVDPNAFRNARRFDSGKMPSLRSGEIPAIIKDNETIFTPGQLRQFASLMSGKGGKAVNINNNFAGSYFMDAQSLMQSMRAIAAQVTSSLAADVTLAAINNDHPIRSAMRGM